MYSLSTLKIMKYHHGNLKEELISSACTMCEATGHDHMSLRSIAKEANVSQTAPYRHFKTKESLLAEVSKRGFEELTDKMKLAISKENIKSAKDRFLEMGLAYLEFGLEKRKTYDLMHSPIIDKVEFPELLNAAQGAFDELVQVLTELFPGISEDDLGKKCIKFWAMMHGLVGLLDMKIDPDIGSNAADAMSIVKKDFRSFLVDSLEL
jgi:AcrR family transcriptional regulator